jgi:hypothetical protein
VQRWRHSPVDHLKADVRACEDRGSSRKDPWA